MKRAVLFIVTGAVLAGLAFYLRQNTPVREEDAPAPAVREISLYHYFSGDLSGGLSEMIETVNERQPENKVVAHALDHEAFKSMIHTTLAKAAPPELFSYWAGARVQELVDQKKLEPIDDLWSRVGLDDRFPRSISEAACTYDGRKYLLPITQYIAVFLYNKRLFKDQGLSPPATWEEFLSLSEKLRTAGIDPVALGARERWPAQFWFDYLLLRTAGAAYREKLMKGKASYTDPEVKRVYRIWGEILQKGYFNEDANSLDWAEAAELVCSGTAAMTLMGTWAEQLFAGDKCGFTAGEDYDFFMFPALDELVEKVAVGPIDGIVLTRESENHEFAKDVLAYFAEIEPQQRMSEGSGSLAPSILVPRDFYSSFKQRLIEEIKDTPHWAFNYDLATPPPIADKGMDSFNELIEFPDQYESILENLQMEVSGLTSGGASSLPEAGRD